MKMRRNCVRILACVGLCLGFMGTGLAAEGMDFPVVYESEENIGNSQIAASMNQIVSVSDWKRRIYRSIPLRAMSAPSGLMPERIFISRTVREIFYPRGHILIKAEIFPLILPGAKSAEMQMAGISSGNLRI